VPHTELRWLVTAISWGEARRRDSDGARIHQAATLTLHEYIEDPYITPQRPKGNAAGAKFRWYVIKHNENLKQISKRMLGNPSKWQQIEKLNHGMHGYRIPQPHFKAGSRIKIPHSPQPAGHHDKSKA
jgi:nucleoid-associated protein YgaU